MSADAKTMIHIAKWILPSIKIDISRAEINNTCCCFTNYQRKITQIQNDQVNINRYISSMGLFQSFVSNQEYQMHHQQDSTVLTDNYPAEMWNGIELTEPYQWPSNTQANNNITSQSAEIQYHFYVLPSPALLLAEVKMLDYTDNAFVLTRDTLHYLDIIFEREENMHGNKCLP